MKFSSGLTRVAALLVIVSGLAVAGTVALHRSHPSRPMARTQAKCTVTADSMPTITLETDGASFMEGSPITLAVSASDADGDACTGSATLTFYDGTQAIYSKNFAAIPESYQWTNAPVGTHHLSASVSTFLGNYSIDSDPVVVVVHANTPPTVALTAPANGAMGTTPATFNLAASANDSDGTIAKVEFYNGAALLGTDATAPFSYAWSGVAAGSYSLTAIAYDNNGASTTSAPVSVSVDTPPVVSLTSSSSTATAPGSFTLTASATDADGTIAKVDFYSGTTKLGTASSSPYTFAWTGVAAGNYTLTAKAYDDKDITTTSAAVQVSVSAQPPTTTPDLLSDVVGATPGQFRVDESGAATYSVPIVTPPGVAGVVPQVALSYSSQGGDGPLGKGWAISGLSGIARCRQTREAGDFISGGKAVDGNPQPINFTASDQFCLDGQRLIPAPASAAACATLSGATITQFRGEIDGQQRVCAYAFDAKGPRFFTVERKDGSTSWFGDRRTTTTTADAGDGAFGTAQGILNWNLTRFQDSAGNYIDYSYLVDPVASNPGEQHISKIAWTGKNALPGQSGGGHAPTQSIVFNYSTLASTAFSRMLVAGYNVWQTQQLDGVTVSANGSPVRYYAMSYWYGVASPHTRTMSQLQECSDKNKTTCLGPTTFGLTTGQTGFVDAGSSPGMSFDGLVSYKLGDVDGDGRQDIVWIKNINDPGCQYSKVFVSYGQLDSSGKLAFSMPAQTGICVPMDMDKIPDTWKVFDYNGDGREDLIIPTGSASKTWAIYPSLGRPVAGGPVFAPTDLASGQGIPAFNDSTKIPDFADINGDGQLDAIYAANGNMYARISERRADQTWGWGAERAIQVATNSNDACGGLSAYCTYSIDAAESQHYHLNDFDGDGRADILVRAVPGGCSSVVPHAAASVRRMTNTTSGVSTHSVCNENYLEPMAIQSIGSGSNGVVTLRPLYSWEMSSGGNSVTWSVKFADINGDGLTDALVQTKNLPVDGDNNNGGLWKLQLNDGRGFFIDAPADINIPRYNQYMQLTDVNGDGRADLVYPNQYSKCAYLVRYANPDGTFGFESTLSGPPACNAADLTTNPYAQIFADFDGDGTVDYVQARLDATSVTTMRAPSANRFSPHDVIQSITNGYGAVTTILYSPLTNAAVYRPDTGSLNTTNYGRGSPVVDLLAPMYVVANVASSAPVFGDPGALSDVYYTYAGAKMQAGGRGYLGFRELTTIDANHAGQFVATTTDYRQDFPFIGSPTTTTKTVVSGNYVPARCLTDIDGASAYGNNCFLPPGNPFTAFAGTNVSQGTHVWEASPAFSPTIQRPMQVRTSGTEDILRDLLNGAVTSDVGTGFSYNGFGDVTDTVVDTYSDAGSTLVSEVKTHNTYVDDEASWRLGRMTASTVTHTRNGNSIVRKTAFTYDMSSAAKTGQLLSEEIQPGGSIVQDRRTVYALDDYGNRLSATTCSSDIATCAPSGMNFHPANGNSVQRYSRTTYDSRGQYPTATYESFWNGTGATEVKTQQVLGRDALGNVLQAVNAQGVQTLAVPGQFGRPYYTWTQTVPGAAIGDTSRGAESWTTYRWCGSAANQVSCPRGAVFRQRTIAEGSPSKWTYFDVLGRPLLAVGQTFNAGVAGQEFSGICTYSDAVGLSDHTSIPFFLADASSGGDPRFASQADPCATRDWAVTSYDILGRPLKVMFADSSHVSTVYAGLTTTTTDQRSHQTVVVKNALGEKLSVTDSANLTTHYDYDAAGDLLTVGRDGGRGNILTSYVYDTLGRKTSQVDVDTGTWVYTYNAVGELLTQTDGKGQQIKSSYDARGRVWRKLVYNSGGTLESTSLFNFDYDANSPGTQTLGALVSESISNSIAGSTDNMARGYSFDAMGRPIGKAHAIDGNTYTEVMLYDALGRMQESKDATNHWLRNEYAPSGYVRAQCEGDGSNINSCAPPSATYVATVATDNWGHAIREQRGTVTTVRGYDAENGRLLSTCSTSARTTDCGLPTCTYLGNCPIQDETYRWDAKGNLTKRTRGSTYTENFTYDVNDRMIRGYYSVLGTTTYPVDVPANATAVNVTEWMTYDPLGNICQRVGDDGVNRQYTYSQLAGCGNVAAGSANSGYQLLKAGAENFATDANGSMTRSTNNAGNTTRGWDYDSENRAVAVWKGASADAATLRTRWDYDARGARFRRTDDGVGSPASTTLYLDNVERVTTNGSVTWRRTIAGVAVMALAGTNASLVNNTHSLFQDQIGSIVAVADAATGALVERGDYSAFGGMRTAIDGVTVGLAALTTTTRGFTGHEQLGSLDLIHMNGRIYDPLLGRFLQADPMVAEPGNPQNWNPYSYVLNNPLANTDPTGMFSVKQFLVTVAAIAISIFLPGSALIFGGLANSLFAYMVSGFVAGVVSTGSLKGGLIGAFSAGMFYGIGEQFDQIAANQGTALTATEEAGKVLEHGIAGGVMSVLQGGKFGNGFVSAGVTEGFSGSINHLDAGNLGVSAERVVAASIVGGTASRLTGGKFADGAITGAFSQAFNDEHSKAKKEEIENSWKMRLGIGKLLQIETTNGEELSAQLVAGERFEVKLNSNGEVEVSNEDSGLILKSENALELFGSGLKWKAFDVTAYVTEDKRIEFSGTVRVPVMFKFLTFEYEYTRSIDIQSGFTDPSWAIGRAGAAMQPGGTYEQRINRCIEGIGVSSGGVCR